MTEQEWLASEDPAAMLAFLTTRPQQAAATNVRRISNRKLRLFACACCRQVWHLLTDERSRRAVEVAERFVDGEATLAELDQAHSEAYDAWGENLPTSNPAGMARYTCRTGNVACTAEAICRPGLINSDPALMANLLRDIAGNPFRLPRITDSQWVVEHERLRPGVVEPHQPLLLRSWLTPDVLTLAQAAYQERPGSMCEACGGRKGRIDYRRCEDCDGRGCRACGNDGGIERWQACPRCQGTGRIDDGSLDPIRLAVLADALEEAGCTDERILGHLRSLPDVWSERDNASGGSITMHAIGPHVRGCWALDLILGKE